MRAAGAYQSIWRVVARIPRGRVATYGQIAQLAGLPSAARQAGYAMHALPSGSRVPWQRVVNARGEVSARSEPGGEQAQRDRQVEVRTLLGQVGGRPVDSDPLGWQREADRGERRAHSLAAFGDCLVRQADNDERGKSGA